MRFLRQRKIEEEFRDLGELLPRTGNRTKILGEANW